jgi:sugar (pentulose or hexulose) kinase
MNILMGIDLGTTGLKVTLWEESGRLVGSEYCEYPILTPQPGFAEQDPEAWWSGLIAACRQLEKRIPEAFSAVVGIGLCGQMHTGLSDQDDKYCARRSPDGPTIQWDCGGSTRRRAKRWVCRDATASTTYTAPRYCGKRTSPGMEQDAAGVAAKDI